MPTGIAGLDALSNFGIKSRHGTQPSDHHAIRRPESDEHTYELVECGMRVSFMEHFTHTAHVSFHREMIVQSFQQGGARLELVIDCQSGYVGAAGDGLNAERCF